MNITVIHGAGASRWTTDTAGSVDVVIAQRAGRVGRDTVTVIATDRFGISDTSTVTLYFGGFSARLTFNVSALGLSSLGHVPALVRLDTSSFVFSIAGQNSIGFTDIQGRPLPFQIESWDSVAGRATIWVLIDTLPGGSAAPSVILTVPAAYGSASQPSVVFAASNGYAANWHMNENGSMVPDATAGNDGAVHNGNGSEVQPALIADGISFDGASRYIDVTAATGLNPSSDFTISGWFSPAALFDATTSQTQVIFEKTLDNRTNVVVALAGNDWNAMQNADGALLFRVGSGTSAYNNSYNAVISINRTWQAGQWYHFSAVHVASNPLLDKVYINGVDNTSPTVLSHGALQLNAAFSADIRIGGGSAAGLGLNGTMRYFAGVLDEVGFASTARSSSWMKFCYENQRPGGGLISFQRLW